MRRHPSVTVERVAELVKRQIGSLENPGICFHCGEEADGCEPDAREYECEACGAEQVYGAEEALIMLA